MVVLTGEAALDPHPTMSEGYTKKYLADIKGLGDTVDQFHADYSVAIHITPTKLRGF